MFILWSIFYCQNMNRYLLLTCIKSDDKYISELQYNLLSHFNAFSYPEENMMILFRIISLILIKFWIKIENLQIISYIIESSYYVWYKCGIYFDVHTIVSTVTRVLCRLEKFEWLQRLTLLLHLIAKVFIFADTDIYLQVNTYHEKTYLRISLSKNNSYHEWRKLTRDACCAQ